MTITVPTPILNATEVTSTRLRNALTACLLSAAKPKDSTVPVLQSVRLVKTEGTLVLTSTDRYRLTRVTIPLDSESEDFSVILDRADVARIIASLKGSPSYAYVTLRVTAGVLTLRDLDGSTLMATGMTQEYPKVDRIIADLPNPEDVGTIAFNPAFLIDLAKMPGRERNIPVILTFRGHNKPATSEWENDNVQYFHLLMNVRVPA